MSSDRFFVGVGLLLLVVTPLAAGASAVRGRFLPSWHGVSARVAEAVLALGAFTVIAEALGVVGALERWTLVPACAATGAVAFFAARVRQPVARDRPVPGREERRGRSWPPEAIIAALATALVGVQWLAVSLVALRNGMNGSLDTLWYHGPLAARFAQEGSITAPHYFDNPVFAFYPMHSEVWHATGILLFGDDVLSPLLNLVFFALALGAAWSIGERFDAGPLSLIAALVVIGTPGFLAQPGGGSNDIVVVALLLASIALLLNGGCHGFPLVLAATAAGIGLGVKLSMVAPVAALTVGVVLVAGRGRRLRVAGTWLAVLAATGGVWYVRNVVVAGSPLPVVDLSLGPLSLPSVPSGFVDYIAHWLTDWSVVRGVFIPGLDDKLGPAWWAILLGAIGGGTLIALWGRHPLQRIAGGLVVVAFVAYLFAPIYLGFPGNPAFFRPSVRYAVPALALGLVMLPALPFLQRTVGRRALVSGLTIVLLASQVDWHVLWPAGLDDTLAAGLMIGAGATVAGVVAGRRPWSRRATAAIAVGSVAAAAGATWFVQRDHLENRYAEGAGDLPAVAALRDRRDSRIATDGFILQYPLYGPDLSNHVQYLGERHNDGSYRLVPSCPAWKRAVNHGRYDYVLVTSINYILGAGAGPRGSPPQLEWARSEPALREIARDGIQAGAFEVMGELSGSTCP